MVADVDGTLVGPDGDVSDAVVAAVDRARSHDVRVGFATGRMRLAVNGLQERLQLSGPHVLHNGAEVRLDGATVASWPLDHDQVVAVLDLAERLDRYVELYTEDGYVVNRDDPRAHPHWRLLGVDPIAVVGEPPREIVFKATFGLFDPDDVEAVVRGLERLGLAAGPAGSPVTPDITYVNATADSVDKGAALRAAAAAVDADLAGVVAIGDAGNDLSLLAAAGTAVAMGQAEPEIRAVAHLVAPSVTDDGVADVLDRVLHDLRAG